MEKLYLYLLLYLSICDAFPNPKRGIVKLLRTNPNYYFRIKNNDN